MTTPSETALSAAEVRREIEAIKACPHCGGESDRDRGRIVVLHWVADRLEADAARSQPATEAELGALGVLRRLRLMVERFRSKDDPTDYDRGRRDAFEAAESMLRAALAATEPAGDER